MYPENYDIIAVQGDTIRWSKFFIDETTGTTFNFNSNYILELTVRNGYYPASLVASYFKQVLPGMTLTSPQGLTGGIGVASGTTGGTCNFCIGWSFSNEMSTDRMCKYDFKANNTSTNSITTLLRGNIQILPQVNYIQNL
jgi:hypothetical protein